MERMNKLETGNLQVLDDHQYSELPGTILRVFPSRTITTMMVWHASMIRIAMVGMFRVLLYILQSPITQQNWFSCSIEKLEWRRTRQQSCTRSIWIVVLFVSETLGGPIQRTATVLPMHVVKCYDMHVTRIEQLNMQWQYKQATKEILWGRRTWWM